MSESAPAMVRKLAKVIPILGNHFLAKILFFKEQKKTKKNNQTTKTSEQH